MTRLERPTVLRPDGGASLGQSMPAPAPAPEPALGSLVQHYLELARYNLRLILALTLAAAAVAGIFAIYQLNFSPVYRAVAKVTVQPTDAELRFTQVYVRSSNFDSANVVTRSHIEYLNSREIAARTYDILWPQGGDAAAAPDDPVILGAARAAKDSVRGALAWLNSGSPAVAAPEGGTEDMIDRIQDAIRLRMIESSFIMEIGVDWDDPHTAADIANVLAQVYQARSREQVAAATTELTRFLERQKAETEATLSRLLAQRNRLRAETGIVDLVAERGELLTRLFGETAQLDADRSELDGIRALISAFLPQSPDLRFDGLSQATKERINVARLREVELVEAIAARERIVLQLQGKIGALAAQESAFESLNSELDRVRTQLDDIDSRLLGVRINQTESIETLRVIDLARPPAYPAEPQVLTRTALGGVGGLLLALMVILARDFAGDRLRTQADLTAVAGVARLGPVRLDPEIATLDANQRGAPDDTMRPFLGWYEFDTDDDVSVLDVSREDRARAVSELVLDHYPYNDKVHAGLAGLALRPGYMPRAAAILVTLGRGEISAADLGDLLRRIRARNPAAPVAVSYVDAPAAPGGRVA